MRGTSHIAICVELHARRLQLTNKPFSHAFEEKGQTCFASFIQFPWNNYSPPRRVDRPQFLLHHNKLAHFLGIRQGSLFRPEVFLCVLPRTQRTHLHSNCHLSYRVKDEELHARRLQFTNKPSNFNHSSPSLCVKTGQTCFDKFISCHTAWRAMRSRRQNRFACGAGLAGPKAAGRGNSFRP